MTGHDFIKEEIEKIKEKFPKNFFSTEEFNLFCYTRVNTQN